MFKAKNDSNRGPWYRDGLRFQCQQCGRCCGGAPGVVWVNRDEAKRIAKRLGVSLPEFYDRYTHRVGSRISLIEQPNGDCIMLRDGKCVIYEDRPLQCRTFPWWPWNLKTPEDWAEVARECPGCNRGRLHTYEEIERERRKRL